MHNVRPKTIIGENRIRNCRSLDLKVNKLKRALLKKGFDPLIKKLAKTVSGKKFETLTSKQRDVFMHKLRRCIGIETEEISTEGLTLDDAAPCIFRITCEALRRSEFTSILDEELERRISELGEERLMREVKQVLYEFVHS